MQPSPHLKTAVLLAFAALQDLSRKKDEAQRKVEEHKEKSVEGRGEFREKEVRGSSPSSDLELLLPETAVQGLSTKRWIVPTMLNTTKSREETPWVILNGPCL